MQINPHEDIKMSYSQLEKFKQCPSRWKMNYIDDRYEKAGIEAVMGSYIHQVFEDLYALDGSERTLATAEMLADLYLDEYWENALEVEYTGTQDRFWDTSLRKISNLWKFEDPTKIDVWKIEHQINGNIDNVIFKGFADRIDNVTNGEHMIVDYKSGAVKHLGLYAPKLMQIVLYAKILRDQGMTITRGRYIHLESGIIDFRIDDIMIGEALKQLKRNIAKITDTLLSGDQFTARTGPLCAWCPFSTDGTCVKGSNQLSLYMEQGKYLHSPAAQTLGHTMSEQIRN